MGVGVGTGDGAVSAKAMTQPSSQLLALVFPLQSTCDILLENQVFLVLKEVCPFMINFAKFFT